MPTTEELRALVDRYAAAVTSRDVDAIVSLFTEDAVQADPANTPPNVGHEGIGAFFTNAIDASQGTAFEVLAAHTCGNQVAIDFRITVTLETGQMIISGIEVFTVADDCRISAVSAYWDDSSITFA